VSESVQLLLDGMESSHVLGVAVLSGHLPQNAPPRRSGPQRKREPRPDQRDHCGPWRPDSRSSRTRALRHCRDRSCPQRVGLLEHHRIRLVASRGAATGPSGALTRVRLRRLAVEHERTSAAERLSETGRQDRTLSARSQHRSSARRSSRVASRINFQARTSACGGATSVIREARRALAEWGGGSWRLRPPLAPSRRVHGPEVRRPR
jgi:hypothetical protein